MKKKKESYFSIFFYFPLQHFDYLFHFRNKACFTSEWDFPIGYLVKTNFRRFRSKSSLQSNKVQLLATSGGFKLECYILFKLNYYVNLWFTVIMIGAYKGDYLNAKID